MYMLNTRYSCEILIKFQYSQQTLEKSSIIKLLENPSPGQTDRQSYVRDKANIGSPDFYDGVPILE